MSARRHPLPSCKARFSPGNSVAAGCRGTERAANPAEGTLAVREAGFPPVCTARAVAPSGRPARPRSAAAAARLLVRHPRPSRPGSYCMKGSP